MVHHRIHDIKQIDVYCVGSNTLRGASQVIDAHWIIG